VVCPLPGRGGEAAGGQGEGGAGDEGDVGAKNRDDHPHPHAGGAIWSLTGDQQLMRAVQLYSRCSGSRTGPGTAVHRLEHGENGVPSLKTPRQREQKTTQHNLTPRFHSTPLNRIKSGPLTETTTH